MQMHMRLTDAVSCLPGTLIVDAACARVMCVGAAPSSHPSAPPAPDLTRQLTCSACLSTIAYSMSTPSVVVRCPVCKFVSAADVSHVSERTVRDGCERCMADGDMSGVRVYLYAGAC